MVSAGALYGLLDASDALHEALVASLGQVEPPLVVIVPVLADAERLAERLLGRPVALRLFDTVIAGEVLLEAADRRDVMAARRVLQDEVDVGPSAALAMAVASRLGIGVALCSEPGLAAAWRRQGVTVLPAGGAAA